MFRNYMKTIALACVLLLQCAAGCGQEKDPIGVATLQLKRKQNKAAVKTIRTASPEVRNSYAGQIILARAYRGDGQHEKSIKAYKRASAVEKGKAEPFIGMADVEIELGSKAPVAREGAKHFMRASEYLEAARKVDNEDPDIYSTKAELYEAQHDLKKALEARREAARLDPDDTTRQLELVRALREMGKTDEATRIIERVGARDAATLLEQANLLVAKRKLGYVEQAKSKLLEAEKEEGTKPEVRAEILNLLASLCVQARELDEAMEWLAKLEKFPRFRGQAMYQKGTILLRKEKYKEAYEQFKLLQHAKIPLLLMQLGFTEEKLEMPGQAVVTYEKIVGDLAPRHVPAHYALARLQLGQSLYQKSMNHCKIILEERPDHEGALRIMARIHRLPSGKLHSRALARICYLKILLHNPNSVSANLDIADLYLEQLLPGLASTHAKRANAVEETERGHITLGRAWLLRHRAGQKLATGPPPIERAIEHMRKAYAISENKSATAAVRLAHAYAAAEKTNTSNKAVALLGEHISRHPRQGQVYIALADQFERMKNAPEAVKVMERAAGVRGIEGFNIILLGRAQFLAGRYKDAIATWDQVIVSAGVEKVPVMVRFGLVTALASDGQHARAMTRMETIINSTSRKVGGSVLLAACLAIQAGQYGRAAQFIDTHDYPSKGARQPYVDLIELCKKRGDEGRQVARLLSEGLMHSEFRSFEVAISRFKIASQRMPEVSVPLYLQISALIRAQRSDEVPGVFSSMFEKFPEDGFAHYQFAMMKPRFPNEVDQRKELDTALDLDPELAPAHMALADLLSREAVAEKSTARRGELLAKALSHCEEARRLQGGGTQAALEQTARVHYAITKLRRTELLEETNTDKLVGRRTSAQESATATRKLLQELKDRFPSSLRVVKLRVRFELLEQEYAVAATMAGDFIKNERAGDGILQLLFVEALIKLGRFGGKPESLGQARAELGRMIRVDPLHIPAYRTLANLYAATERPDLLVGTLARMRKIDRSDVGVALKLAAAYMRIDRPDGAMAIYADLERMVESAPENASLAGLRRVITVGRARSRALLPVASKAERNANISKGIEELDPLTRVAVGGKPYVDAILLKADLLYKLGKFPEALRSYEAAEQLAPKNMRVLRGLLVFHLKRRQYDKAVQVIQQKVIPLKEHDPFEYSRLSLALIARGDVGDVKAAQAAAMKASDLMSRRRELRKELPRRISQLYRDSQAVVRIAGRRFRDARTTALATMPDAMQRMAYTRIIDGCSRSATKAQEFCALFGKFALFSSLDERDETIAQLKKLLVRLPRNYYILTRLAAVHNRRAEMVSVAEVMEQQIIAAEAAGSAMRRADLRALYGELISTYLTRLAPHSPATIERANAACERALKKWPRDLKFLGFHARVRSLQRNDEALIAALTRITEAAGEGKPEWVGAHKQIALECFRMKRYKKSLGTCDLIAQYVESDAGWLNNWAWLLATKPNPDFDKAILLAHKASRLSPTSPEIRDTLGWILHLAGRWEEADKELKYAARQKPSDPSIRYHLGANLFKLKKYKEAVAALEMALELARTGGRVQFEDADACKRYIAEAKAKL